MIKRLTSSAIMSKLVQRRYIIMHFTSNMEKLSAHITIKHFRSLNADFCISPIETLPSLTKHLITRLDSAFLIVTVLKKFI